MSKTPEFPSNAIVMGSAAGDFPPWTDSQRDAQIEASRLAWMQLVRALHEQGVLDMHVVQGNLEMMEWVFSEKPDQAQAAYWYRETIAYMRAKTPPFVKKG